MAVRCRHDDSGSPHFGLGWALAIIANLLNPSLVVIGGDMARAGDLLLDPVRGGLRRHALGPTLPDMSQVPAATRALRVLRFLASQPGPVPVDRVARVCELPRSTAYHLLRAMADEGFVIHLPEERTVGLGVAAFEVGSGWTRSEPLARIARRPLADLADATGQSAQLAVLHGRDVLYVVQERAPGRPPLVTGVGVRLPAQVTASGRAILSALPAAQVRALFGDATAFVTRDGHGPARPSELRALLSETRQRGHAVEHEEVTAGLASLAVAVLDHTDHPVAAVAVTHPVGEDGATALAGIRATADLLSSRVGGRGR